MVFPRNVERRVAKMDAPFRFGAMGRIALVRHNGLVADHNESMGKALGDKKLTLVAGREDKSLPLPKSRTTGPYVYRYVPDGAVRYAYEFRLRVGGELVMESPDRAHRRMGFVLLYEMGSRAPVQPVLLAVRFHKVPPLVVVYGGL